MDLSVCFVLFSSFLMHGVSKEMPPASLEVWPDSRQHFRGDQLSLHCSVNDGNSTGWMLKRLQGTEVKSGCLQLNGTASIDRPIECHFIDINSKNSGMYWCEGPAEDKRSKTINITVSYGEVILFSPVHPVMKGGTATLQCKSLLYKVSQTVFYKNGVNFLSLNGTEMTIENVTKADEGFYKCAFANSSLESSEIWLSRTPQLIHKMKSHLQDPWSGCQGSVSSSLFWCFFLCSGCYFQVSGRNLMSAQMGHLEWKGSNRKCLKPSRMRLKSSGIFPGWRWPIC
ncbi:uncharacterized protein LOC127653988 isoform X2 [Xyrauchen texanus]|uniref:uncharacterized protein LOC127653988 isoform X2 n=1 Tax=Xyrauchen texanus TaxID=154827 RepID=UPI002242714F|nr:uncharacterized protein LOC127653988 isoform X2 [Xyrauchen texanus]